MDSISFNVVSDIHVDSFFSSFFKEEETIKEVVKELIENTVGKIAPILFILGDLSNSNKTSVMFLEEASKFWKRIYVIQGNHDFYGQDLHNGNRWKELQELVEKAGLNNVTIVEDCLLVNINKEATSNPINVMLLPLMYNFNSYSTENYFKFFMNDSLFLNQSFLEEQYKRGKNFYENNIEDDSVLFVMSHVPFISKKDTEEEDTPFVNLSIPTIPNKIYFSGHTHEYGKYCPKDANKHFYATAVGYYRNKKQDNMRIVLEGTPQTTTVKIVPENKGNYKVEILQYKLKPDVIYLNNGKSFPMNKV